MNLPTVRAPAGEIAPDRALEQMTALLSNLVTIWSGGDVTIERALTTAERDQLRRRLADLVAAIGAVNKREAATAVSYLLGLMGAAAADAEKTLAGYMAALDGIPAWAIKSACGRVLRGEVRGLNPDFAPRPPRLAQLARELVIPLRAEVIAIDRILHARPIEQGSPGERERMVEKWNELLRSLSGPRGVDTSLPPVTPQASPADCGAPAPDTAP